MRSLSCAGFSAEVPAAASGFAAVGFAAVGFAAVSSPSSEAGAEPDSGAVGAAASVPALAGAESGFGAAAGA